MKKTWKKLNYVGLVGTCKYCQKDVKTNQPFVIFATKEPAHYKCMKDDEENKQYEVEIKK